MFQGSNDLKLSFDGEHCRAPPWRRRSPRAQYFGTQTHWISAGARKEALGRTSHPPRHRVTLDAVSEDCKRAVQ